MKHQTIKKKNFFEYIKSCIATGKPYKVVAWGMRVCVRGLHEWRASCCYGNRNSMNLCAGAVAWVWLQKENDDFSFLGKKVDWLEQLIICGRDPRGDQGIVMEEKNGHERRRTRERERMQKAVWQLWTWAQGPNMNLVTSHTESEGNKKGLKSQLNNKMSMPILKEILQRLF